MPLNELGTLKIANDYVLKYEKLAVRIERSIRKKQTKLTGSGAREISNRAGPPGVKPTTRCADCQSPHDLCQRRASVAVRRRATEHFIWIIVTRPENFVVGYA